MQCVSPIGAFFPQEMPDLCNIKSNRMWADFSLNQYRRDFKSLWDALDAKSSPAGKMHLYAKHTVSHCKNKTLRSFKRFTEPPESGYQSCKSCNIVFAKLSKQLCVYLLKSYIIKDSQFVPIQHNTPVHFRNEMSYTRRLLNPHFRTMA